MRLPSNERAGMTLIEVCISALVMALLMGSIGIVVLNGQGAYHQGMAAATLEAKARRGVDLIAEQFTDAERDGLNPDPMAPLGSQRLDFHRSTGSVGKVIQWGNTRRIDFQYAQGEVDDGADNDGDGLIDEGRVVLTEDLGLPSQRARTLISSVAELAEGELPNGLDDNGNGLIDEMGLSFNMQGDTLVIRLTLEKIDYDEGRTLQKSVATAVWIRN